MVNFAAESHNSLAVLDPGRFFRTNVLGTQALLRGRRRVGIGRFHHISTCEVYGDLALDCDESFDEETPVPAPHAVQRVQGGRGPRRPLLRRDLRPAGDDHQLLQQLRALPVPREGHPALHDPRPRRPALPLYASTGTGASGCTSSTTAGRGARAADGRVGRDLPRRARARRPASARSPTGPRRSGKPAVAEDDRARTAPATTAATCSTRPRSGASSGGRRRSSFDEGMAETVAWYAANRCLVGTAAGGRRVVESAWRPSVRRS